MRLVCKPGRLAQVLNIALGTVDGLGSVDDGEQLLAVGIQGIARLVEFPLGPVGGGDVHVDSGGIHPSKRPDDGSDIVAKRALALLRRGLVGARELFVALVYARALRLCRSLGAATHKSGGR